MKKIISIILSLAMVFLLIISVSAANTISIFSIKLDKKAITLSYDQDYSLKASITPKNSTQKLLVYSTSNQKIATVDSTGKITAVGIGNANITATSTSNKKVFAVVNVTVNPKEIHVGTGNAFKPFCYLDENGKLQGFEYETLKEVDKRLPEYKFTFQTFDFVNILLSLESGKIDLAAHYYAKNAERVQKYLYTDEGVCIATMRIIVAKDSAKVNSIADLAGKNVYVTAGSNNAYLAEKYNAEHNNDLKLVYGTLDNASIVQGLVNGTIDATFGTVKTLSDWNTAYGNKVKLVGDPIYDSYTYYIVNKNNVNLKNAVDSAIRSMKQDGTLSKIAISTVGSDVTKRQP